MAEITNNISNAFDQYIIAVGLGHLSKKNTQIVEMRRAFFAGAVTSFQQIVWFDENIYDTDDKIQDHLDDINLELENFVAGVEVGEL